MPLARRSFLSLSAAALAGCGTPPAAGAAGQLVSLQLVDRERGDVLGEHRHRGTAWVAGRPGARYAVRLANRSGGRVLVVLSVDGVNAISGQSAAASQTGYVLAPWQVADITGWRKSDDEAAAFYFTALPDSYAARTGRPHNVGVIGAAVFRERAHRPPPVPFEPMPQGRLGQRQDGGAAARAASPEAEAERDASASAMRRENSKLGTGHGEREHAPIERTAFERASTQPAEIVQLRYDSHANLVAAGVIAAPPRRWGAPNPFPGFVADPP
jgi:hypothetical protein